MQEPTGGFMQYLPFVIPIVVLQLGLAIYSLIDLSKQARVRWFNKWIWAAIIIFGELVGPLVYLFWGRQEE